MCHRTNPQARPPPSQRGWESSCQSPRTIAHACGQTNKELRSHPIDGGARTQKELSGRITPCVEGRAREPIPSPPVVPGEAPGGDFAGHDVGANMVATFACEKRVAMVTDHIGLTPLITESLAPASTSIQGTGGAELRRNFGGNSSPPEDTSGRCVSEDAQQKPRRKQHLHRFLRLLRLPLVFRVLRLYRLLWVLRIL